ncbi:MAG: alpha/beta hydrolase [Solirubrobacteraceae bacterium]
MVAGAAVAGIAAGLALQRRHLRALAADEDFVALSTPLHGRALRVISADGSRLHAEEFGPHDGPPVVLAHGWTERIAFWGPVIERLTTHGLRVVAYDLRGHGRSGAAHDRDYTLQRFGEDLEAVLAAVSRDGERATVVGHSLGAMSIAAWAEHHDPRRWVNSAALVNTGLGDLVSGHLLLGEIAKWLNQPWASRALLGSRAPLPPFSTPLQQALIRYTAFGPDATPGQVAFYERMLMETPASARAAVGVALTDMDLWHALERLTVPTLVIAGERDRLTPPAHARRMAEELPDCVGLIELPATGHMSPLERPDEVSDALTRLVTDARAAAETGARV